MHNDKQTKKTESYYAVGWVVLLLHFFQLFHFRMSEEDLDADAVHYIMCGNAEDGACLQYVSLLDGIIYIHAVGSVSSTFNLNNLNTKNILFLVFIIIMNSKRVKHVLVHLFKSYLKQ